MKYFFNTGTKFINVDSILSFELRNKDFDDTATLMIKYRAESVYTEGVEFTDLKGVEGATAWTLFNSRVHALEE